MNIEEAVKKAKWLNGVGKHNDLWWYYAAHYEGDEFFVMRRRKDTELRVAVYRDGTLSGSE